MPRLTGIGTWFAPGSAAAANNASDDIDSTLRPGGSYFGAGETGAEGDAISQGAGNLANVSANFDPMDHDSAALASLSTDYLGNYLKGGGAMTQAQLAQSGASIARMNGSQLAEGSYEEANKVGQTQAGEAAYNASGATQNRAASQALAIKKAAMQMLISHTNHMTAIERNKLQAGVSNLDASASQALQGGANDARSNQMTIFESGRLSGANTAIQIGTGIAGGASQIAGTVGQFMPSSKVQALGDSDISFTNPAGDADANMFNATDGATQITGSALSDGVIGKLTSGTRSALASNVSNYNPYSEGDTNSAYPLASAWGMTSLASTLPS